MIRGKIIDYRWRDFMGSIDLVLIDANHWFLCMEEK
jgi:hypothetical protein